MKTQVEREAEYERVVRELGVDRIGTGTDAPPLPPRSGREPRRGSALPVESEVYAAVKQYEYGEIWSRPGLDVPTRCFISVVTVAAMGHEDQLYRQINTALNVGITPDEIHEALLQVSVYGGISAWEQAAAVADEVFVVRGILAAGDGVTVEVRAPMDHADRKAAAERVMAALAAGRLGTADGAPPLPSLPGSVGMGTDTDPLGQELAWIGAYFGYGEVWGRTGLELRTRSFMTIAILQVMHENDQLHFHVNNALNLGITAEEIREALVHAGLYGGTSGWNMAQ
ncbi:MAG: carboxymuconolactone decarboxylase family protein, partial [Acidimicrobiia bacterium]